MPHYCRHCQRYIANERFKGRGHRIHLCKECIRRPKHEIEKADHLREIQGFLRQSHISDKNCKRLAVLAVSGDEQVSQLAELVDRVAAAYPYKRRRLKKLARTHRELIRQLEEAGLIEPRMFPEYFEDSWPDSYVEWLPDLTDTSPTTTNDAADDSELPF